MESVSEAEILQARRAIRPRRAIGPDYILMKYHKCWGMRALADTKLRGAVNARWLAGTLSGSYL